MIEEDKMLYCHHYIKGVEINDLTIWSDHEDKKTYLPVKQYLQNLNLEERYGVS